MSQIIHDLAPGADLRFATALNGEQDFASQIGDLATAGAKVIVEDVTYLAEPMYQYGVIGMAVVDVTAQGVTYFSSAANSKQHHRRQRRCLVRDGAGQRVRRP
jgi:hypothetical protein